MAGATQRRRRKSKITLPGGGVWLVRALGAYVLLQFGWWAYLLAISGTDREQWMVLGEGSVFATLLLLGLSRIEQNIRRERRRLSRERNMLLGVTHELKTPLANVQLGVDSLRRLTLSDADKEVVLENMQSGISDLERRVEDMLVATRLQRESALQHESFSWGELVGEACGRMGALGATRVQWEHDAKVDDQVRGDRGLWMLATTNLIDNALKYSDGEVWVKSTFDQHTALLEVQDAGPGISKDDLEAALSPFVRLQENGSGTGLGLHLVSQTAKLHGARLDMNSLREGGFVVRIEWPSQIGAKRTFAS